MQAIKCTALVLSVAAIVSSSVASAADSHQAAGWNFSLALGPAVIPAYVGADTQQVSAALDFNITYTDLFFASVGEGIGFNFINVGSWRAGTLIKYDLGRLENGDNPLFIAGDKTADLQGLGDIDGAAELGVFLEYTVNNLKGRLETREATGGHDGMIAEATFTYSDSMQLCGKTAFYEAGVEFIYGDKNYNSAYFGVTPRQAAASGLSEYVAGAGLVSYGLDFSLVVPIDQHVSVIGFVKYLRLAADAENSSLVVERGSPDQALAGLLLNYSF